MAFDKLGHTTVLIFAAMLAMAAATLPAQTDFGPRGDGDLTELVEDSAERILIRQHWGLISSFEKIDLVLAIPASGPIRSHIQSIELTPDIPTVEGDTREPTIYTREGGIPLSIDRLHASVFRDEGFIRGNRVGRLTLQPRLINLPDRGAHRITGIEVSIDVASAETTCAVPPPDPQAIPALEALVLNDDGLTRWRVDNPPLANNEHRSVWRPEPDLGRWLKIEVEEPGATRVNFSDLPVSAVDPERIRLVRHGETVPLWLDPAGSGFVFIAADDSEPYAPRQVYWLDLASGDPTVRMERLTASAPTPEEATTDPLLLSVIEEDGPDLFESLIEPTPRRATTPTVNERRAAWVWQQMLVNEPLRVRLPNLAGEPGTRAPNGRVTLDLVMTQGVGGVISHIAASCGDESANATIPAGNNFRNSPSASLPADLFQQGWITLTPESQVPNPVVSANHRRLYLDRLSVLRPISRVSRGVVRHPVTLEPSNEAQIAVTTVSVPRGVVAFQFAGDRVGEVATSLRRGENQITLRGSDWRVVVGGAESFARPAAIVPWEPVALRSWDRQADMLIITHRALWEAGERLADHRRNQGLTTEVIDVQDIYDSYGSGVPSPDAILAFLIDAFESWPAPAPAFVTLLGDCSRDYHGDWRTDVVNYVPSFIRPNPSARGVYWQADDHRYSTLAGGDALGDVFLGRLSAVDAESAMGLVDKIIAYDLDAPMGPWRSRAGFIADNDSVSNLTFDGMCEEIRLDQMDSGFSGSMAYLRDLTWVDNILLPEEHIERDPKMQKLSPATTSRIRDMFNDGAAVVTYFGHGGPNIWTDERIWFGCDSPRSDNLRLTNTQRQPFVVNMTCSSGAIDSPDPSYHICISEDFLRVEGGAIGCFVPTGEGIPSQHRRLTRWLMRGMFEDRILQIGPATALARWRFVLEGRGSDLVESFVMLGDPALRLALPQAVTPRDAAPVAIERARGGEVSFDASPASLRSATGEIRLISPIGEIAERREATYEAHQPLPRQSFAVSPEAAVGRWTLSAHWWNEDLRTDELVQAEVWVEESVAEIGDWAVVNERSLLANEDIVVEVDLRRTSQREIAPIDLSLVRVVDPDEVETLVVHSVELPDRQSRRTRIPLRLPAGVHRLALECSDSAVMWSDESQALMAMPKIIAVQSGEASSSLVASSLVTALERRGEARDRIGGFRLTVANVGGERSLAGSAHLLRGNDVSALGDGADVPPLDPGETATVRLALPTAVGLAVTDEVRAVVNWPFDEDGADHGEYRVALSLNLPRADVTLAPEEWRIIPESPSEGETIWIEAIVENRGDAQASNVRVELRAEDGTTLENRADSNHVSLPILLPGESSPVRLRWDPRHNAGANVIRVAVDRANRIDETDEGNNEIEIEAQVRTRENVRLVRAVRWVDPQVDPPEVTLTTQISNFGQTDARDYLVTWYRDQDRTSVIGETPIPLVRAGATIPVEHRWSMSPEDASAQQRGVSFSPTCDLGLRVGMRRVVHEGEGP